jgi:hypothetical protein
MQSVEQALSQCSIVAAKALENTPKKANAWQRGFASAVVELLLNRGGEPNLPDDPPWATALAWATRRGHTDIVQLLKQHGAP